MPSAAGPLPTPPQPRPVAAGQPHLHTLHLQHPPGPFAILWTTQGLAILVPGDVRCGGAPGITQELQGGAGGQQQLFGLA